MWIPGNVRTCPTAIIVDIIEERAPKWVEGEDLRIANDNEKGFGAGDSNWKVEKIRNRLH
jgi:hypothetical protein